MNDNQRNIQTLQAQHQMAVDALALAYLKEEQLNEELLNVLDAAINQHIADNEQGLWLLVACHGVHDAVQGIIDGWVANELTYGISDDMLSVLYEGIGDKWLTAYNKMIEDRFKTSYVQKSVDKTSSI